MGSINPFAGSKLGSTFEQFFIWGVLQQIAGAVLAPVVQGLQQAALRLDPNTPMSPADVVEANVKGHLSLSQARDEALNTGLNADRLQTLIDTAGEPPGIQTLLDMWRRGIIPESGGGADSVSVEQGIRESRVKDKWIDPTKQLKTNPIATSQAVDAVVEGQIDYAQGERIAFENGTSAADFRILVNTRGNPPSPADLIELVRRRIIPMRGTGPDVTSLQQGIYEGSTKDKWEPAFEALVEQVPPPRTVTALLRAGVITEARALQLFQDAGLSAENAAAYVADAHHQKTQADRELAKGDVLALYLEQAIDTATATKMLGDLGFHGATAAFLLSIQDFHRTRTQVNAAVTRVRGLYVSHHIDEQAAMTALDGILIPHAQRDEMLHVWKLEREANVQRLTAAEYADAAKFGIIAISDAIAAITALGFTPRDARTRVELVFKGPLTDAQITGTATQ